MTSLSLTAQPSFAAGLDAKAIVAKVPSSGRVLDVPFIAQKRFDCGPASVAMVLRYHGVEADADEIAKRFETKAVAGTFTVDLLIAAANAGMDAHWRPGDLTALREEINRGRPAIVFLNLMPNPIPQRHFAVAVGYLTYKNKDYVVLHSGDKPFMMVPAKKFQKQWDRTGGQTMTVAPPGASSSGPPPRPHPGPPDKPKK